MVSTAPAPIGISSLLSQSQEEVINDSLEGSALVFGPAGGGKTLVTLYRANVLHKLDKRVKVFAYTNVLLNFVRTGSYEVSLPQDDIESFYAWVYHLYEQYLGRRPPNGGNDKFAHWTDELIHHFERQPPRRPLYDYVLVDEAQDFPPNVPRLLRMISRHLFVAGDTAQSIFESTNALDSFIQQWEPFDRQKFFFGNYRNPKHVARLAAEFVDGWDKQQFVDNTVKPEGTKPVWYKVSSVQQESEVIAHIVKQAGGTVRIGILLRYRNQIYEEKDRLVALGIHVQVALSEAIECDFRDGGRPIITTYHSAKGLEFDWVILPGMNGPIWNKHYADAQQRRLFFVGVTRTKDRLYFLSQVGDECRYLRELPSELVQVLPPPGGQPIPDDDKTAADDDLPF